MSKLRQAALGTTDIQISVIGFGAVHLAYQPHCTGNTAEHVLCRVIDLGVTLIDTADRYCQDEADAHANERQIASALRSHPGDTSEICVATKGGMLFPDGRWVRYGKPEHIRATIRESHMALGGEKPIDLWQYHQLDRNYPLEETLGAVKEAVDEGLIRHVGVSNFHVEQIERARQIVDIVSVQNEYSLWARDVERNGVLEYCEGEGLTFFAWRPLGGKHRAKTLDHNATIAALAEEKNASPQQLALAWLLAKSSRIIPIPGSTRVAGVEACVGATEITLDTGEMLALESAIDEEPPSLRLAVP